MTVMLPSSVRRRLAKNHTQHNVFHASIPNFLRVDVTTNRNPPKSRISELNEKQKLLPGAKRWLVKFGRRARNRLRNGK